MIMIAYNIHMFPTSKWQETVNYYFLIMISLGFEHWRKMGSENHINQINFKIVFFCGILKIFFNLFSIVAVFFICFLFV